MTVQPQPEALRLADCLDLYVTGDEFQWDIDNSAAELRRLHEVNADLLNAAKLFIKYDSYQYDGSGMLIAYNDAIEATKAAVKKSTKDIK